MNCNHGISYRRFLGLMLSTAICSLSYTSNAMGECYQDISSSASTGRLVNNGDGTVSDQFSGLMWKRCSEGQAGANCAGLPIEHNWQSALLAAAALNIDGGFAGYTDWRLPNIRELASLVRFDCVNPATDMGIFPSVPNEAFWSSSPAFTDPDLSWVVSFDNGATTMANRLAPGYIRLVRGGL